VWYNAFSYARHEQTDFQKANCLSTYTLAFGPFETAWRSPQRLVFTLQGETVADVHYRASYNERGCAERLPRLGPEQALHLVTRICGSCSHAHAMAYCQAIEELSGQMVPERAVYIRIIAAELERQASHLETLTTIFQALDQQEYAATLWELAQSSRQGMLLLSGRRIIPDICLPGGLRSNLEDEPRNELLLLLARMNRRLSPLLERMTGDAALTGRTVDIGVIGSTAANQFGLRGPMARASGLNTDMRLSSPYAAYTNLVLSEIVEEGGDVYARILVLLLEAYESVKLVEQALHDLPGGKWEGSYPQELLTGQAHAFVEAPRGMLHYTLESDGRRITRVTIDPPRQLDRLLARALFIGASLDNLMLITLSTDVCLTCAEC
jgi:Ni,Fe-hydrogenase III large subunit